jgi:hypothetical protein
VEKGIAYENEVADEVETELIQGNLGLDPSLACVLRKPSYFSRDRQKNIVFDVSIEVRRRGAVEPYWIWVWECKNYSHTVPVDDVEEFHAKLLQIGPNRAKGTMITPTGFGSGAIEYAKSKGIGLWRFVPSGSLVLIMEDKREATEAEIIRALTTQDTTKFRDYGSFYALTCTGHLTTDRTLLIKHELQNAFYLPG